jgi:hypothetical protein
MNFEAPLDLKPCCLNLRHKLMYCDPRQATPGLVDSNSDTRVYLCVLTQEVLGPDGIPVSPADCCTSRSCYCAPARPRQPAPAPTA